MKDVVRWIVVGLAAAALPGVRLIAQNAFSPRPLPDSTWDIHVFNDQLGSLTPGRIAFAATHYAGTQKMTRADADLLRATNPGLIVLHYRLGQALGYRVPDPGCSLNGSWIQIINGTWVQEWPAAGVPASFLYTYQGQSVAHCTFGHYLLETGDPGFRAWWMGEVLAQLANNDDDGVFADSLSVPNFLGASGYNPPLPPFDPAFEAAWVARIQSWIAHVAGQFAGQYYLIPNVGYWVTSRDTTDPSSADGVMIEGFGTDVLETFGQADWQLQMDRILSLVNLGRAFIGQSYAVDTVDRRLFTLGSWLLVKGGRSYVNLDQGLAPEWWPEYEIPVGAPLAPPPAAVAGLYVPSNLVYEREFTNGRVIVNPSPASRTVNVTGLWYRAAPSGGGVVPASGVLPPSWAVSYVPVSQVTVGPGEAAILVRDPAPHRLSAGFARAGLPITMSVTHATPGATQYLLASAVGPGFTPVPGANLTLGLVAPLIVAEAVASPGGTAGFTFVLPPSVAGLRVWLQVAEPGRATNVLDRPIF